ncbi:MAG: hypothetical protein GX254_11565 [Clostridiales bacterium]|nr:hypothetical protein [Clostridiales bacterium]
MLTYWTVNFTPRHLPEDGLDGIDFCMKEKSLTGVDIEYYIIPSETRQENFTALLAAVNLPDILLADAQGIYQEAYDSYMAKKAARNP